MKNKSEIIAAYESRYGVKTVPYDCAKKLPKNKIAVEICDDGTVIEHGHGGINYVKM
jgi:hypothetical protein